MMTMLAPVGLGVALLVAGQIVHGQALRAPHGGVLAPVRSRYLELVVSEHQLRMWVLDQRLKTVPPAGLGLAVRIAPRGRPKQWLMLAPEGDHFCGNVDLEGVPALTVRAALRSRTGTVVASMGWTLLDARDRLDDTELLDDGGGRRGEVVDPDLGDSLKR
jgi:hypothetical protein